MSKRKYSDGSPDPLAMPLHGHEACTQGPDSHSCSCGRCIDGWLSPNLAGLLCAAAEMERDQLLDAIHIAENEGHFGSTGQRKPLDLEDAPVFCPCLDILPRQVRRKQLHKAFLQGFAECFDTIAALLGDGSVPTPERVLCGWRSAHWAGAAQSFFCTRGGSVELALQYVVDHAPEVDEFYDSSQQPRCANDTNYARAAQELLGPGVVVRGRYGLLRQQPQYGTSSSSGDGEESDSIGGGAAGGGGGSSGDEGGRGYDESDDEWELGAGARRRLVKSARAGLVGEASSSANWKVGRRVPGGMPRSREQLVSLHSRPLHPGRHAAAAGRSRAQATGTRAGWRTQDLRTPEVPAQAAAAALSPDMQMHQLQQQHLLRQQQLLQLQAQWQLQQQQQQEQQQQQMLLQAQWQAQQLQQQQGYVATNPIAALLASSGWVGTPAAPMVPPLVVPYTYALAASPSNGGQRRARMGEANGGPGVGAGNWQLLYGMLAGMQPALHHAQLAALAAAGAGGAMNGQARRGEALAAPAQAAEAAALPQPHSWPRAAQQPMALADGAVGGGTPMAAQQVWGEPCGGGATGAAMCGARRQQELPPPRGPSLGPQQQDLESTVASSTQAGAPPPFAAVGRGQAGVGRAVTTVSALAMQQQQERAQQAAQVQQQAAGTPAQEPTTGSRDSRESLLDAIGLAMMPAAANAAPQWDLLLGMLQQGGRR